MPSTMAQLRTELMTHIKFALVRWMQRNGHGRAAGLLARPCSTRSQAEAEVVRCAVHERTVHTQGGMMQLLGTRVAADESVVSEAVLFLPSIHIH